MAQYSRKPMLIEAHRWDDSTEMRELVRDWFKADFTIREGMWVVRDQNGKAFVMDNDVFHATFEPTDQESAEAMGLENDVQKVWG